MNSGPAIFATTHWSVVLAAGQSTDARASAALEELCRAYWYPLYAYLRRDGRSEPDAQDLTQGFFEHLLERRMLDRAVPGKGRFRSFLLGSLKYYVANQQAHERRQKRGGGQSLVPLDAVTSEQRYRLEPQDARTPEQVYERRWALALLDRVLDRLRAEHADPDRAALFDALQPFIAAKAGGDTYAAAASRFGRSEEAIKKMVQRMRRRYQELIRQEIAHTVSDPAEIEDELRHLCKVIRGG